MINNLQINGFKCFDEIAIDLGKITLFSGTNSSGKSSAIQALLVMDNAIKNPTSPLNGAWLDLGKFDETRNFITRPNQFSIKINQEAKTNTFTCLENETKPDFNFNFDLNYLSANRIGPQNTYQKNFDTKTLIGEKGEFLMDLLYKYRNLKIDGERQISQANGNLEYQVNSWLKKLFNVKLELEDLGITNLLSAKYSQNNNKQIRPYHIGTGISYVVGILILGLYLPKGSILVVENPEIHLHPKAQSELANFFCFIANAGVQVIIESHSDHIFNGIRKSVFNKTISNNDAKIHFFEMKDDVSVNHLINLSEKGKILDYQEGLFDQFDNDLNVLLGF
ncbi:DUF3696 domain-containing protein [Flavobacterium branchiophilum]|uniref:DUF3696 domain-containing protein n=1 Tax=Flavobacterium branchiophilum (strain FL-15) TaxID=1034807 RepID=G2Z507_FLABF|nr:DUF3696 domain-containing protein [Flavobacterium branchiophilum]CCB70728.1 Protein of unknown function [Flavobacterium branchiophilum FL-15]